MDVSMISKNLIVSIFFLLMLNTYGIGSEVKDMNLNSITFNQEQYKLIKKQEYVLIG